MRAVGYHESLPIENEQALIDLEIERPSPGARELLVKVEAISVNPVDTKVRRRRAGSPESPVVLGWDAAGTVEAIEDNVLLFKPGDEVFYAGAIGRAGSNAEFAAVDERIVGRKPRTLTFSEAAALPLTTITAWEALFDRFKLVVGKRPLHEAILIIGAAGGVGSMAVQLARRLTSLTVIGTASRPESQAWVLDLGAHSVIDHSRPLSEELARIGRPQVRYVLSLTNTDQHWDEIAKVLQPQGEVCFIDDPGTLDILKLKNKAASIHIEFMFARPMHGTIDMIQQHMLLSDVAALVDEGLIRTTLGADYGPINAANLRRAHAALESGHTIGKIVLTGFAETAFDANSMEADIRRNLAQLNSNLAQRQ